MEKPYESRLHVPGAYFRPGEKADYSFIDIPAVDASFLPAIDAKAIDVAELAHGLIRVLDDDHEASGPWWQNNLDNDQLLHGLKTMQNVRVFDDFMFKRQRQGKLSFYMKSTGEEAVAVAQGMALADEDMLFPSYRQQGLLFVRDRAMIDLMCQCLSNSKDNCKGRQLPVLYSAREQNFFTISGNLATQFSQAVGWAMASAYKGEEHVAATWVGDGSTAEADVYYALVFASTYRAPVILNVVNNQWAISTPQSFAACGTTFAARSLGFSIPGLRVDGNDFLAVHAVTDWAAKRARAGHGATFIELYTYRGAGHSTSDNPDGYRPVDEWADWPLGDPIERLKQHLIKRGLWTESEHDDLVAEQQATVERTWKEAQTHGTLEAGPHWPVSSMFEDVFKEMPRTLKHQLDQLEYK